MIKDITFRKFLRTLLRSRYLQWWGNIFSSGNGSITASSTIAFVQAWLRRNNFHNFQQKFANYCGNDILMLSREDIIQIGRGPPAIHLAESIRLHNAINSAARVESKSSLLLYIRQPDDDLHMPVFVKNHTVRAFIDALAMVTLVDPHKIERVINRRKCASTQGNSKIFKATIITGWISGQLIGQITGKLKFSGF